MSTSISMNKRVLVTLVIPSDFSQRRSFDVLNLSPLATSG